MPKIFEPFYTTRESGTGLGLWVVREKLTDLGGAIRVESGNGTTVTILIPVEPAASTQSSFTAGKLQEKDDVRLENPARG